MLIRTKLIYEFDREKFQCQLNDALALLEEKGYQIQDIHFFPDCGSYYEAWIVYQIPTV